MSLNVALDGAQMACVDVSHEMLSFIGPGILTDADWPADPVAFIVHFDGNSAAAICHFINHPDCQRLNLHSASNRLVLIVNRAACERLHGDVLPLADEDAFHLPPTLRTIGLAIRDFDAADALRTPYRLAKSIELLCEALNLVAQGGLIPVGADGSVSMADSERLMAARRIIDERWTEKLTLATIARDCGLNRAKLTRGFRELFACSVSDAIAKERLANAQQMLVATDLPVSAIGYKCGYLNNASFSRAFARHFGRPPSQYRAERLAA